MTRTTKLIAVFSLAAFLNAGPAVGATVTFDETVFTSIMTRTYDGTAGTIFYSESFLTFSTPDLILAAGGATSAGFESRVYFRTTFDNRPHGTYPYQHISGNLAQVYGTELLLMFRSPISTFGFGAALDSTASPGLMDVELLLAGAKVGAYTLDLVRSSTTHGNSNSEGGLTLDGIYTDSVRLINRGDGQTAASNYNWVIDNIAFKAAPVPEPATLALLSVGLAALTRRTRFNHR